jgi:hypothetical protein
MMFKLAGQCDTHTGEKKDGGKRPVSRSVSRKLWWSGLNFLFVMPQVQLILDTDCSD